MALSISRTAFTTFEDQVVYQLRYSGGLLR